MASQNKINVSLISKETPVVSLTISDDSGTVVASATDISPVIKFIATGSQGANGLTLPVEDGTITSAKLTTNSVTTSKIKDGAVTEAKIKVNSVGTNNIIDSAVTSAKIAADAVNGSKIANNSIGAEHIIDGTVTTELFSDGIITTNKYGDLSISTAKVKDLAITSAKLANNLSLGGTTTVTHLIGLGTSPFTITGPATDNFELISNQDLVFQVDANQATVDGNNSFIWKNGSGTQIAALDESGNLSISGTVDGFDISSLQNLYPTADATKVGFLTVTQAVNLDTLEANVATNNAKNTYPTADATKVGYLQITQSVDLDLIETNLAGVINKTQHVSVTQAVNLDTMESNIATNNAKTGITPSQASAITANTAKTGITTSQANAITANTAKVDLTVDGAGTVHSNNYTDTNTQLPLIDSDTMSGASATNVPSAESVKAYVDTSISNVLNSPPAALDTLNELAAALGDDANFSSTVTNSIALKAPIASPSFTGTIAIPNISNIETAIAANTAKETNVVQTTITGNAGTATALTAGDKTIDGSLDIGSNQAGHDLNLYGANLNNATAGWVSAANLFKFTDNTKLGFGTANQPGAVDSSIQANGSNLVISNTVGNIQIGDTVEITGDLTVTGTVDGIDIATDVAANTAKTSFPGLGTSSTTALAGDTALLQLGTSGTTALAGNTTTISGAQASAITANTAKTGITTGQANAITANTAKVDLTVDGAGTVHANNYTNTTYSEATSSAEGLMSTAHHDKLGTIAAGAEVNVQSDWNSSSGDSQILNKPTIPAAYADADAVSAVATADNYIKNDASDEIAGTLQMQDAIFLQRADGTNTTKSKIRNNNTTGNRTLTVPDASGIIATTNVHHHFIHAGWFMSYPYARYIPLNGSLNEQNTATLSPEYVNFTFPYDGYVKKMMLRTETDMGSTELKLYKGASGATVSTALGAVTETVAASNAVEFDFTSVSNAYSKGDTMAIKVDPTDDPDGGQNITIELVFDLTT